ncbi:hypothetical protein TRICI_001400 [Trichomonascus ciferrii]|uniref:Thioesterase domain-containing protein n=1 Tax=Trichomonascus ciferrii TaxID=44093 RepID=A0A642VAB7_9ASCO|nr:hypothetical protein TRICI_001400 [Trichomonascus ciferrii]
MTSVSLDQVREVFSYLQVPARDTSWGGDFVKMARVESVDVNEVCPVIEFHIETKEWMNNMMGFVHGGCATTMADNISTWAIMADPRYWKKSSEGSDVLAAITNDFGVSRNLNLTFVRPIPLNSTIAFVVKVQSNTKRYTHLTFEIIDPKTKKQYVLGTHDKAKTNANAKI